MNKNNQDDDKKTNRMSQGEMPRSTLKEAMILSKALADEFAGEGATPIDLAEAVKRSPSSSAWRFLTGAAVAYGLIDGGYNSRTISLTLLGKKLHMPTDETEDAAALLTAALTPSIPKQFYEKYDRNKLPSDNIAKNVLRQIGVLHDRLDEAFKIIIANAEFVGITKDISGSKYIQLETSQFKPMISVDIEADKHFEEDTGEASEQVETSGPSQSGSQKIFIAHGKNKTILDQIKVMLELGDFNPIIAEEQETTAKPVPKKVLDQMRECHAAVISVTADEGSPNVNGHFPVNQNVLIEIGAAFVLYDERVILVWDKRVDVPSNLQGLYRCEYEGEELSWVAGTQLQKALLNIKQGEKPKL